MNILKSALLAAALLTATAHAQPFPSKPIRVVVPYPPGAVDVYVRLMQPHLEKDFGVPFVVENRPGASGFIGTENVVRSAPDGYTLVAVPSGSIVVAWSILDKPPFDTRKDFSPITRIYSTPSALVAKTTLPVNSLKELIDYAKKNPGKLSYGSTGMGGTQHVDTESFKLSAGLDIVHIPFNGFAPVVQALLGQQVDLAALTVGVVMPLAESGKVKVLATYGEYRDRRPALLKKYPDVNDTYPDYWSVDGWIGYLGPAGVPRPVVTRLNTAMVKALHQPSVSEKVEGSGAIVVADSPEEFSAAIKASLERMAEFLKKARAAGVKFE